MAESPRMTGAGLIELDEELIAVGMDPGPDLSISIYDLDLNLVHQASIPPFSEENHSLLAQSNQTDWHSLPDCHNGTQSRR